MCVRGRERRPDARVVNTQRVLVPNDRPPRDVTLEPVSSIGTTSLSLRWGRSTDRDFAAYMVFRNETGTVTDDDTMLTPSPIRISTSGTTWD